MRSLRQQLIQLLDQARIEQHIEHIPPRVAAVLLHNFMQLLPTGPRRGDIALQVTSLSHQDLHRHILTIRCPDQAFFLDAIKGYLLKKGITPLMQQTMVAMMECDDKQCMLELKAPGEYADSNFMFIALHISATLVNDIRPFVRDIHAILQAVQLSVRDFSAMRKQVAQCATYLLSSNPDAGALLEWLNDNRYLFFGLKHNTRRLGLFRNSRTMQHIAPGLSEAIAALAPPQKTGVEWLPLAATHQYLYSAANVEVMRITWQQHEHTELKHIIIIGHFSRSARHTNASHIPVLAAGWRILGSTGLLRHSAFYHREIRTIYDRLPKPVLMYTRIEDWLKPLRNTVDLASATDAACDILQPSIAGTPVVYIAISALRYGPNTFRSLIARIQRHTGIIVHGHESIGIGPHRVILVYCDSLLRNGKRISTVDPCLLQRTVSDAITFWKDRAKNAILEHSHRLNIPEALAEALTVPPLYEHIFPPEQLWRDMEARNKIHEDGRIHIRILQTGEQQLEIHILSAKPLLLGLMVNQIQAFGILAEQEAMVPIGKAERQIRINRIVAHCNYTLHDESLARLKQGLDQVFNHEADHDPLNELILATGLDINHVSILITLRNHLIQLMPDAARSPLIDMLLKHADCSHHIVEWFVQRHDPTLRSRDIETARLAFLGALENVKTLTEDRWFRALGDLVQASLRTNAFTRTTGAPVAVKIDPQQLGFAPEPRPWREIFVHGPHLEGVHLRAGPVARGGIRYSDRPSDFRMEVLELMDTQTVKNGQIIPTGAKGGFVTRNGEGPQFVLQQYRTFIHSLLSITDNRTEQGIMPAANICIADNDANDPYLVVAADKGTARFSDEANAIALERKFWLGDAFASGGKHGYDHKSIGITARGAWVCAAEHFRRLGINAWQDPISVVGIGDMSGDVLGNGMLLNPNIRLLAAFNHRHIFLDPEPDIQAACAERRRLFREASSWDAYNPELISKGGGVFERSGKAIKIPANIRRMLAIEANTLSGEALIRAILSAPVDLLYNGGIGTYVKSSQERHEDVYDPANNAVRIDAAELRCKVVCEGGNLGFTQQARMEFSAAGGLINTDAIDNSAGVDMSDHEVNLKLLFSSTPEISLPFGRRNRLLKQMSEEVTQQCLHNNLMQSRALHVAEFDSQRRRPRHERLVAILQETGWLDADKTPEQFDRATLAILLGQEKNRIHQLLNEQNYSTFSMFSDMLLADYFPAGIRRRYRLQLDKHPLACEIIHTQAANHIVNHLGIAAALQLQTLLDHSMAHIVEALFISETLLESRALVEDIWQTLSDANAAASLQQYIQEAVLQFAEELLRIADITQLDQTWLTRQLKALHRFGNSKSYSINSINRDLPPHIDQLPDHVLPRLLKLLDLAQFASALKLAARDDLPPSRALQAAQASFDLIPFYHLEQLFRSPVWGTDEAHALRRLCLQRLTRLKATAIETLLQHAKGKKYMHYGKQVWSHHPCWCHIHEALPTMKSEQREESLRTRSLLLLNQIEAVIMD